MKYLLLLSLFLCACIPPENIGVNILPSPQQFELKEGKFLFDASTGVFADSVFFEQIPYLKSISSQPLNGESTTIALLYEGAFSDEEYILDISEDTIAISATTSEGIIRGIQTLRQLLPLQKKSAYIPALSIHDYPRFSWRGMLLDCSRHFMEKDFVKRYIDLLALHKMNVLHWHLTEDQGWRIEIEQYPKLTEIGAWRTQKDGSIYGGFYTKEDIREIVAYAKERHITVVPEIELPGHSLAALASYPQLSCTGGPFEVENDWGVFKDIYCAGNDSVFMFLENVLDEVLELFPSKYIHIGGDEAPKYRWDNCNKCKARMRNEGLDDSHQLQSYFITRIERYLNSKGRQIIGWDEILEGGLAPSATVQSWRGMDGGIAAAKSGHYAIMSPTSHAYFDYDLDAIDLQKVYSFEPIPSVLSEEEAQFILGGECNMWSERAPQDLVDSKVFPRLLAMSEVLWTTAPKDYPNFYKKVQKHYDILDAFGVDYGYESVPITSHCEYKNGQFEYRLFSATPDITLEYRLDNSDWKSYSESFFVSNSVLVEARGFKNGKPYGEYKQSVNKHIANGKKVSYAVPFSPNYPAKEELTLTDGLVGSNTKFRDGRWQGFYGESLDVLIDLEEEQTINTIDVGCFQYNLSWILMPKSIRIYSSDDGINFEKLVSFQNTISPQKEGQFRHQYSLLCSARTRYIRLVAENFGILPDWHPAAGSQAWLFVDEIMIR
ncbi:MAG: family 20 glycosylhydrolase [Flavobacteriales bacterium]|nr:family 20 glycosylhydrolase [Flavobacteriales bacterium]